ncbi:twin-arginine translocase subunit TatC [Natronobiforma cellulositropha]|uniref:twin-arginine translocase subunit TatC n=1 Tax=Natronobiforma cellulositropha TaxID=1679076 RepID=UPI0021D5918D|nr:twin-arginine translocase subunit TatC [Natronobiforma cellulositropha]
MSSALDEDTAKAINSGRESIGALVSSAQTHGQKIFIVFVIGFLGSFYALRLWIWDFLEATAKAQMDQNVAEVTDIITRTPFEVILLQAKIGLIVGAIIAIPALLYYSRDALKRRGFTSAVPISRAYVAGFVLTSLTLFWVGIIYAYAVFFPYAFDFLAANAVSAGVKPSFGITQFTEFMALLTFSFGLAAQLPLFMGALAYTEVVPYETFRDKWRHAIVAITVFGAFFSPPDPFTLIMWAIPLVILYVFSLGLAKVLTNTRRRGAAEAIGGTTLMKRRALQSVGALAAAALVASAAIWAGLFDLLDEEVYPLLPEYLQPGGPTTLETLAADHGALGALAAGLIVAAGVAFVLMLVYTVKVLQSPVHPRIDDVRSGDPEAIDLDVLDAGAIEAVPPQAFLAMDEDEVLGHARTAMYDDDREKAQAILDRYDTLQAQAAEREEDAQAADADAGGAEGGDAAAEAADAEEESSLFASTAADVVDAFTEEETTEDDIGGYAYDIAFIFQSLTSKMFYLVGLFMVVMGGTFIWLYSGGLQIILEQFASGIPEEYLVEVARQKGADLDGTESTRELIDQSGFVIALHPVEVLIFEVKVSLIAGIVSILPLSLYFAWPAMKERGLAYGDRRTFIVWGGSMLVGFFLGTVIGFLFIAPALISYLISDALAADMIVSFQISHFAWLVLFTTVGVGFLMNIVVTMGLFHVGGIVSYRTMLEGWRFVVVGIFTISAFASPSGIITMLIFAVPLTITYLIGLALLYVLTAGGRLFGGGGGKRPSFETGLFGR